MSSVVGNSWKVLDDDKKRDFELLVISTVHAFTVSVFALWKLSLYDRDYVEGNRAMCSFSLGYFLHDFWAVRDRALSDPVVTLHHILACFLVWMGLFWGPGSRHANSYLVTELSTGFLNLFMGLELLKKTDSAWYIFGRLAFVLSFIATRVIWLPYNQYIIMYIYPDDYAYAGWGSIVMWGLIGVNVYFFWLIIKSIAFQPRTEGSWT